MKVLLHELANQQRLFWRSRESAFFTFLLPIILLVVLGSVYGNEEIDGVQASSYLVAGMIGFGVVATAYAGLAINTVIRRESGVLKRIRGTPLPPAVYLGAAVLSTLIVIAIEVASSQPNCSLPKFMAPRQSGDTLRPERPRVRSCVVIGFVLVSRRYGVMGRIVCADRAQSAGL